MSLSNLRTSPRAAAGFAAAIFTLPATAAVAQEPMRDRRSLPSRPVIQPPVVDALRLEAQRQPVNLNDDSYALWLLARTAQRESRDPWTPLVKIPPEYPPEAVTQGLKGWVRIGFTIDEAGRPEDVRVIAAEPPHVFDISAVNAVSRWRFMPKVEDGKIVKRPGGEVEVTFASADR